MNDTLRVKLMELEGERRAKLIAVHAKYRDPTRVTLKALAIEYQEKRSNLWEEYQSQRATVHDEYRDAVNAVNEAHRATWVLLNAPLFGEPPRM
jgi:ribosome recycling factor